MSSITSVSATSGIFNVQTVSGETKSLSFGELMMSMGMMQLELQDAYFEEQYKNASQMAEEMREVNDFVAMLTKFKGYFNSDGKATMCQKPGSSTLCIMPTADQAQWAEFSTKYVATGKINDNPSGDGKAGIGTDKIFSLNDITNILTSAEAYQKNLSSLNEQQMMVTNQAASRRSNVLQQLQTLLTSEKEGRSAATR